MKKLALVVGLSTVMAVSLVGCGGSSAPSYVDGTYEATAAGGVSDITVSVTVAEGKISVVDVVEHGETDGIADAALDSVPDAIVAANSTDVDIVAGATGTSEGIMAAVEKALEGKTE